MAIPILFWSNEPYLKLLPKAKKLRVRWLFDSLVGMYKSSIEDKYLEQELLSCILENPINTFKYLDSVYKRLFLIFIWISPRISRHIVYFLTVKDIHK